MKKPLNLHGFFVFYFALIGVAFLANQFVFDEYLTLSSSGVLAISIAQSSLTGINEGVFSSQISDNYIYFSLLITQLSGIGFLTYLLWLYWKLCKPSNSDYNLIDALRLTLKVVALSELALFIFFFYALSDKLTSLSLADKSLAALILSIGTFNNAGLTGFNHLISTDVIQQNYIIQIAIIIGSTFGSLGIFVINELFSPINLRHRLKNPEIDWSFITKLSVFGAALIMLVFFILFYANQEFGFLYDRNILESVIARFYEISSARGFGHSLAENSSTLLQNIISLISGGPFSTCGGFTLLILIPAYSLFIKKHKKSIEFNALNRLAINLFFISLSSIIIIYLVLWISEISTGIPLTFSTYLEIFTTNSVTLSPQTPWYFDILIGISNLVGRLVFVMACFLTLKQKS